MKIIGDNTTERAFGDSRGLAYQDAANSAMTPAHGESIPPIVVEYLHVSDRYV